MLATSKLRMDLARPELLPEVYVVQDDRYSRSLDISLYSSGLAFVLPEDSGILIRYTKSDGTFGTYDTMPDGSPAWQVRDNVVTLYLAPEICTAAGKVTLMATVFSGGSALSSFSVGIHVVARPQGIPDSRDYVNITGFLPQPAVAQAGQCLKVAWVDEFGRVAGVETGEPEALPTVTGADEGAFLRVVEGVWAAAQISNAEEVGF